MIIVLNGPAGSGKGTLSRMLARYLKLPHYDLGLVFRAIARAHKNHTWCEIDGLIRRGVLHLKRGRMVLDGVDLTDNLMSERAALEAAMLAACAAPRLTAAAKAFVKDAAFIADGRTVSAIFPDADWHFQIVADYSTAERRRAAQGGDPALFRKRWLMDEARLTQSARAIILDTGGKTPKQCVRFLLARVQSSARADPPGT